MWARARGWALWKALITMDGQHDDSGAHAGARRLLEAVLADHAAHAVEMQDELTDVERATLTAWRRVGLVGQSRYLFDDDARRRHS
jgi:hypothetical protein